MAIGNNKLDQKLDIAGSINQASNLISSEESLQLGSRIVGQLGFNASIVFSGGVVTISGLTGMTSQSAGHFLTLFGANNSNNNGTFLISIVNSSTSVDIININGTTDSNNGNISWIERNAYSLEDDINYERTDRANIKGVGYSATVPTYVRPGATTTILPVNLANIAGNTLDAKALINTRKFESASSIIGQNFIQIIGTLGEFPYANSVNRLGLPVHDLYDAGNDNACYCDIIDPNTGVGFNVLTGIHAGEKIFGFSRQGSTGVNGISFEVELRSIKDGYSLSSSNIYVWENGQPNIIDIYFPFRESLALMDESALRVMVVHGVTAGGNVGGDLSGSLPNPTVIGLHIPGQVQGSVLYYNGTAWVVLNPGTDGYVLTTHNSGNNPSWTAVSGSGSGLANTPPVNVNNLTAIIGTSNLAARADHKHAIDFGAPISIGSVNITGTATSVALSDHAHAVVDLAIAGQAKGALLYFNGSNWVVLNAGTDGYVLTAQGVGQNPDWEKPSTPGPAAIAAGTQIGTSGTISFVNSNGISFGMSNSNQITASYTVPTQTNFQFSNSNGINFGTNGSTVTASYTVPSIAGLISGINISGGTTSNNLSAITFSNSNGLSFGLNGSVITGSYTVPNQTAFIFSNSNGLSFGTNGSTITGSYTVPQQTNQTANIVVPSAGTQTATSGTVSFVNSNGISFGMSGSNQITASYTVPVVPTQTSLNYSNSNNVSFGIAGSTLTASASFPNQTAFVFSNSNGISFGTNGSTVTASYTVPSIPTQTNQTEGFYAVGNTVGQSSSSTFDARTMSISGAGIASVGYSGNALIISVPSAGASINFSAGTTSGNLNAVTFSNSNGLSFGLNGSVITASYTVPTQTNQTEGRYAIGNTTGQSSSSTFDARTLSVSGAGNISIGYSGNALVISGAGGGVANQAGTQTASTGTVVFSNSNGISFGMSNSSIITASYTVPSTAGLISGINVSGGTTSNNLSAITFSNSNGLSFGLNGSTITGSYTVPTLTSLNYSNSNNVSFGVVGSTLTASASFPAQTAFIFSNSNGISFGTNASTVTASYTVPTQTNQTVGLFALGNTTQNSSTTLDARSLSFNGLGAASVGYSNGSIQVSVPTQTAQTQSNIQAIYDGVNSISTGTVRYSNSNGISFGINGQTLTASYTVPSTAGLISGINISGGTTSNNLSAITFSNLNGVSFGLNGSTLTASVSQTNQTAGLYAIGNTTGQSSSSTFDARTLSFSGAGIASVGYSAGNIIISVPTAGGQINISAGTTSNNLGALTFSNSNGVSFGLSNGIITATVVPGPAAGLGAVQAGTQTQTSGTLVFSNSNGLTFGMSNSSVITGSYTVPSTAGLISNINISAGTTSNNLTAITFSNSNGISFGLNGSIITGSYTVPTQTNQTEGLYAVGNTTGQSSSSTFDARTMSFSGAGAVSIGYSAGNVIVSAPNALSNINISAGTTSNNLTNFVFSNSNGLSFGLSGSTVTGSYTVPIATSLNYSNSNNVSFGIAGSTLTASASFLQTNQTIGLFALGNTTQNSSTTLDARSLSFNGLGAASVGYSNGSVQVSVPIQTAQTQSNIQAIFDGVNNISTGTIRYSNSNGVSFGINGQTLTASVVAQSAQTQNIVVPSAGTQTATSGTVVFSNSNGLTFGMSNSSVITASYTVPNVAGLISNINVSAGTTSNNLNAITFSNLNGLSFGLNGSTITGSYTVPTQTNQTVGIYAISNTTGQSSSSTFDARSLSFEGAGIISIGNSNGSVIISANAAAGDGGNILAAGTQTAISNASVVFSNSNGISFGMTNSSIITASYTVPTTAGLISFINVSGGTTSNNLSAITFSNLNGLSFGLNGSTITGSYTVPTQTNQSIGFFATGNTTQNSSTTLDARSLTFNGLGAASVGYSNGSIQISVPNALSNINISAGTTSNNLTNFVFSNSNNVSFGLNGSTITATVTTPAQTNQTEGRYAIGNTVGQSSSSTFDARTLSISGAGNISLGYSGNALVISGSQSNQTANIVVPSAGTQSATSGTVVFSNSNGISFGMSNSSIITASYTVPSTAGLISSVNISAGTTSNNLTNFVFSNSNGLAFGLNGSTITGSYTIPTATSLNYSNSNNVSFGIAGSTLTASASFAQSAQTQNIVVPSAGTQTATSGTVTFANSNGISFGMSGSNQITASYTVPSTAGLISGINVSAGTTSNNLNAITFSNLNGISFGLNASTITASYTVPTQTNQTEGRYAIGNTTGQSSSSTFDARTMSISGVGNISVGYSGNALIISGAGGGGSVNISAGTTSNNLTNFVFSNSNSVSFGLSGSTITASIPNQTFVFSNSNNITFGIAGSTITASASRIQISQLIWPDVPWQTNFPISNASFSLQHFNAGADILVNQANLLMALSGNTNSSGALSVSLGIYTMSGSTMSLASSDSRLITWTSGSQTTASSIYGGVSGTRYRTVSLNNWSISAGDYVIGMWFRTTNNGTWNAFGIQGPTIVGAVDANETNKYLNGFSTSSFSTGMVASVNVTDTNYVRTGGNALQQPGVIFLGTF